jgi:hypothetical protein
MRLEFNFPKARHCRDTCRHVDTFSSDRDLNCLNFSWIQSLATILAQTRALAGQMHYSVSLKGEPKSEKRKRMDIGVARGIGLL